MKKTFESFSGGTFDVDFIPHDISKYDVLYHITLKTNRKSIEENGLLLNQPVYKTLGDSSGLLFMSYPINHNTGDCFRWSDEWHSLIVLDAAKLHADGYLFYDDYFGSEDASSHRNHVCIDKPIPNEYILKIFEF